LIISEIVGILKKGGSKSGEEKYKISKKHYFSSKELSWIKAGDYI